MGAPYSQDLRDRVLAGYDSGLKTKQIADNLRVSPAWARRVDQRRRECGETTPRKMGCPGVRKFDREQLARLVREQPDATLKELRDRLGTPCGIAAISMALKAMNITQKKRQYTPRSRTARTSLNDVLTGTRHKAPSTRIAWYL